MIGTVSGRRPEAEELLGEAKPVRTRDTAGLGVSVGDAGKRQLRTRVPVRAWLLGVWYHEIFY